MIISRHNQIDSEISKTCLAWMRGNSVAQLCHNFAHFRQNFRGERSYFVPIFLMTSEGKHLTTEPHEFNAIFIIPPQHFDDISGICQSQCLDPFLASSYICWLLLVRTILGSMFRL
jgi:hypothetical protein